ncbi:MAG TPA: M48 family metalloprotease [Acidimicrobiales bacterium]|nr:M48 family metalloprotease [Acidimicrobiales bacterium]
MIRNTVKTAFLLGAIGGLLVICGGLVAGRAGTLLGLGFGLVVVSGSWWFSDRLAIRVARARRLGPDEAPGLQAMVVELARRAELRAPRMYLSSCPQPNAFATGRSPKHAVVVVTEGLLALLEPAEVRSVIAHELAHIRHRDTLLTSVAAALATGVSALANLALFSSLLGGRSRDDGPGPFGALLAALVAPVAAGLLHLALSRSREFDADRTGADIAGGGETLARALERINGYAHVVPMALAPAQASAWVVNPLGPGVAFARLFSTHPPVAERVARLRARAAHPAAGHGLLDR